MGNRQSRHRYGLQNRHNQVDIELQSIINPPSSAISPMEGEAVAPIEEGAVAPIEEEAVAPIEEGAVAPIEEGAVAPIQEGAVAPIQEGAGEQTQEEQQQGQVAQVPPPKPLRMHVVAGMKPLLKPANYHHAFISVLRTK